MLANYDTKKDRKTTFLNAEIRYLPEYLITNMEIVSTRISVYCYMDKSPTGFLIEDKDCFWIKKYFETFWKLQEITIMSK